MNRLIKPKGESGAVNRFKNEVSAKPEKKKDEDFKAIRVSGEAYEIFRELKYDNRLENMADAVNIVLEVYLEHNKKDK